MQNDHGGFESAALGTKNAIHLLKTSRKYCCACHTKRLSTLTGEMSRSATPATQNDVARRFKFPTMIPLAALAIGTAIGPSLWSLADGCGRLQTVAIAKATSNEHA